METMIEKAQQGAESRTTSRECYSDMEMILSIITNGVIDKSTLAQAGAHLLARYERAQALEAEGK